MKKILLLFCMIVSIVGLGQTSDSTKSGKLKLGISFSPDYCYRSLREDASSQWLADIRDTLEIPNCGYTAGLNLVFNHNEKFAFETGILFSDKGHKTNAYSLSNSSAELPTSTTFAKHYRYLDIPLKVNYVLLSRKIKFFITAGISTNIFLNSKTTATLEYGYKQPEKSKSTSSPELSRINFAGIVGFGADFKINEKANFKIEPLYRRSITPIIKAPVKEYLYSAGLNFGIYFKL